MAKKEDLLDKPLGKRSKLKKDISSVLRKWEKFVKELEKHCLTKGENTTRVNASILRYVCSCLPHYFTNKNLKNLFGFYLTSVEHPNFGSIARYIESLYLSKDFKFFRNLKPVDAARYTRYYMGKQGKKIDIKYLPYLLKQARLIKMRIYLRIRRAKGDNLEISDEEAFDLVKNRYKLLVKNLKSEEKTSKKGTTKKRERRTEDSTTALVELF